VGDKTAEVNPNAGPDMIRLGLVIFVLLAAVAAASLYFHFNPVIPFLVVLGIGIFLVGRLAPNEPQLPSDTHVTWGAGSGIYLRGQDFVPPDEAASNEDQREGDGFR
jgi:hypothetical protein